MKIAQNWRQIDVSATRHQIFKKVPEITLSFWIIKIFCTTVGETAADFLNSNFHLGLTGTTIIMGCLLIITLFFQFASKSYVPGIYWLAVVLISVVGTLITDNLTDHFGVFLETTSIIFSIALAMVFIGWYAREKTLSVHTIFTLRREVFYWFSILFTFALGTAAGDLAAEKLNLGYALSVLMFGTAIAMVTIAFLRFKLNAVLAFWIAYYQADRVHWGIQVCDLVRSPAVKLLYDIYHMQVMEGDILVTIDRSSSYFAHYQTAGNPGRHDLDEEQKLFYPAIVRIGKYYIDAANDGHAISGALPYIFRMGLEHAQLRYREVITTCETIIGSAGTHLRGHEFHWSQLANPRLLKGTCNL